LLHSYVIGGNLDVLFVVIIDKVCVAVCVVTVVVVVVDVV
jgi:hypothetical protein